MIRLTLILLAAVFATLSVAGQEIDAPSGTSSGIEVARAGNGIARTAADGLALDDERGATARALSATRSVGRGESASERSRLWHGRAAPAAGTDPGGTAENRSTVHDAATGGALALVNAERVNLRAGPSTAETVLDQVTRNQKVRVLRKETDGWTRVRVPATGLKAWIFGSFLSPVD